MREQTLLAMRKVVDTQGAGLRDVVVPGLRAVTQNEAITRRRVTLAEGRLDALELWQLAGFWARLRWLVTGAVPEVAPEVERLRRSWPVHLATADPEGAPAARVAAVS